MVTSNRETRTHTKHKTTKLNSKLSKKNLQYKKGVKNGQMKPSTNKRKHQKIFNQEGICTLLEV